MKWSQFLKETRQKLGVTREEFTQLLGITISCLNHWEYSEITPPLLYQDIILQLYRNAEKIKQELDTKKGEYLSLATGTKYKSTDDFWTGVVLGGVLVGAIALLIKALSNQKEN